MGYLTGNGRDGRLIPDKDVVICPDGFGDECAAIKLRIESLHPDFYRDKIIVKRVRQEETEKDG